MSTALTILGAGVTWLLVAVVVALVLGRVFALGERQAEATRARRKEPS